MEELKHRYDTHTITLRPLTVRNCTVKHVRLNKGGYDSGGRYFGNVAGTKIYRLDPASNSHPFRKPTWPHRESFGDLCIRATSAKDARLQAAADGWMCAEEDK